MENLPPNDRNNQSQNSGSKKGGKHEHSDKHLEILIALRENVKKAYKDKKWIMRLSEEQIKEVVDIVKHHFCDSGVGYSKFVQ